MRLFLPHCLVFLAASAILSWNVWNVGIASGYIDPMLHFGAQDEATYTREAISMAREGGWMTPTFLGRWVFEKPPLLMWLSAVSMKTLGIGRLTARLPVILAGAFICLLCFAMVRRERSLMAGVAAAAMAVSSQILFIMARHNMTDILLACAGMCAFAIVLRDPELRETWSFAGFVVAAAAGILAKSIAGILVVCVMGVVVGVARGRWGRAVLAGGAAILVASPWFVYNFMLHREWFLADMGFQILTIGSGSHQNALENHLWFYVIRILNSDLLPLLLALTGAPAMLAAALRRESAGVLAASYFLVFFLALMIFRFNSEQYLCWFAPALILIGALYSPLLNRRGAPIVIALIAAAFVVKAANPERDFGISMQPGTTIAAAPVLSRYCGEHRATDLYILGVDDEFYSAVLPLHRVHYGWIDATDMVEREHPHLKYLGILIPADELPHLDAKRPLYRERLRAWGLDSDLAVATGVSAHDGAGLQQIIRDHPESDFLVARAIVPDAGQMAAHRVVFANAEFVLLESTMSAGSEAAAWSCEM